MSADLFATHLPSSWAPLARHVGRAAAHFVVWNSYYVVMIWLWETKRLTHNDPTMWALIIIANVIGYVEGYERPRSGR